MAFRLLSRAPKQRRRRIRKLRLFLLVGLLGVVGFVSFVFGFVTAAAGEIGALDPARQQRLDVNGYVYASNGKTVLAVLRGRESRVLVSSDQIAPVMKQAIVAIEDRRFFEHRGIDVRGIARALVADVRHTRVVEGGSTITQQFVKNAYVDNRRSFARKVREAALSWQLEQQWGKDRILTAYLNTIYFGNGAYGIQQAARVYFGKAAKSLNLAEAALLAGIPADPSSYDPVARPGAARARRLTVLSTMFEQGDITGADFRAAARVPLPRPQDVRLPGTLGRFAPYFTNYVREQLIERFGEREVFGGGLRVTTTIDLGLQEVAREATQEWLRDPNGPDAALVALDPATGEVLAMVGGRNYRQSQFNLAVQGRRQPGSAFKPFVLAAALERGISPVSTLVSEPVQIPLGDRIWSVSNYEGSYLGPIDLGTATVHSDNAVYAQLTQLIGPGAVVRTAKRLGITSPLRSYFSIALGAQATNPLELARAFSAFANGGSRVDSATFGNRPRVVTQIRDEKGKVLVRADARRRRVLSPRTVGLVNQLLRRVIEEGTGKRAALPGWIAAGKTGTTENYGDAWFVGYTPHLVAAVWVGYPEKTQPMETEFRGAPVAGGTFPALVWKSFMERALPALGAEPDGFDPVPGDYQAPVMVVYRDGKLQRDNGICPERFELVWFADADPGPTADCKPNEVEVPDVVGRSLAVARDRLEAQPLTAVPVYKPAAAGQRVGVVLEQRPQRGRLSSFDPVTLVLAKPLHGVVPDVRGVPLDRARARLRERRLRAVVAAFAEGPAGAVVGQTPAPGVAAAPGMRVRLVVGRPDGLGP